MRAALWESTITVRSVATPFVLGSTRNSVSPSRSPAEPAVRAATIRRSATWPSTTNAFEPFSRKPLPDRAASSFVCSGRCFVPSSTASAASNSPAEIFGKCSDFCAALPPRESAEAASTAVERNGDGTRVRPISSITTPASTQPRPLPPKLSGTRSPQKPISAKVFQRSREKPVASLASRKCRKCDTGALSLMRPRALSRSIDCSSVRTRAMVLSPRQVEDALCDNAEHHLGCAALDRVRLGAQPGARPGAAAGAFALPLQRVDAARRHQNLVAALVELGAVIFHRRRECRMTLACLRQIDHPLRGRRQCRLIDLEGRDLPAQDRILQPALLVLTDRIGSDLTDRTPNAALTHARDHRALMLQEVFCHVPTAIDLANDVRLGDADIVEKSLTERRAAGDQQDRLG